MTSDDTLLRVRDMTVHFSTEAGVARAVDGVDLDVGQRETFCLVGESGCGKSVTALSIMRLVPCPPGRIVRGDVFLGDSNLLDLSERAMRDVRGSRISMVFQEPMTALNPVFTIGSQIREGILRHRDVGRREAHRIALDMLERVRIPEPEQRLGEYPHQLSGGMQQRVMIAMALACRPRLLIADEPTTALDVTIQAQVLDLLRDLQAEMGMSVLLITHDLGVVAEVADWVAVMYAGQIVEYADAKTAFRGPRHPYMISLLKSLPAMSGPGERLRVIPGFVPDARRYPTGCRFHPRCYMALPQCAKLEPELREIAPDHRARCIRLPGYWKAGESVPQGVDITDPAAEIDE
jgi:oligopeptide/dipeptide ABC transporter ATP-binding protein